VAREPSSRSVNDEADCERFCTAGRHGAPVVSDQRGILKQFRAVTSSPHPFQAPAQILTPRTPALPHCLWSGFAGRRAHLSAGSSLWFGSNGMGEHSSTPEGQASKCRQSTRYWAFDGQMAELCSEGDTWCIERYRRQNPFNRKIKPIEVYPISISEAKTNTLDSPEPKGGIWMTFAAPPTFDLAAFLASAGLGRRIVELKPKQAFFSQGDHADSVFYLQKGRAKITVVSTSGKEATVTLLVPQEFVGEEALSAVPGLRLSTATAITACSALKISREEMIRVMHQEHQFSDLFLKFLLARSMRSQADLIDQLFNSSEKRLARILLLMADYGEPGEPETQIPPISQETLAEMIGTTRSRVSFFMNRFRRLGFVEYNGRIRVHKSLLKVVLHDRMPEDNAVKPGVPDAPRGRSNLAKIANAGHK